MRPVLAALALLAPLSVQAQEAPISGVFAWPECAPDPVEVVVIGAGLKLSVNLENEVVAIEPVRIAAPGAEGWRPVDHGAEERTRRFFVRLRPDGALETAFPSDGADPEGRPGDAGWKTERHAGCDAPPPAVSLVHGETIATMLALDAAAPVCTQMDAACARGLFDVFDVHADGRLTGAELSRAMRVGLQVGALMTEDADAADAAGAMAAGLPLAPLGALVLTSSYDYDGDGALSFEELARDRIAPGAAGTRADATDAAAAFVGIVRDIERQGAALRMLAPMLLGGAMGDK